MSRIRTIGAATVLLLSLGGVVAAPASANHTRAHTCQTAGGTFVAGANPNQDRCVVATTVTTPPAPSGAPVTTFGEPTPSGPSRFVDGPDVPTGEPTVDRKINNVGEETSVRTVTPGTPSTSMRTVNGTPVTTTASGSRNCERVNNENANRSVERCERTTVATTVTPTTVFTTVTTPQTERIVFTQQRVECVTTTQPTTFVRTTTQPTTRTSTTTTPQSTTTTTTTRTFAFQNASASSPLRTAPESTVVGTPVVNKADPLVVQNANVAGEPIITPETMTGTPIVTGPVCTATTPTTREETNELEPTSVTTSAPGTSITTMQTTGTGQTCFKNPSNAEQRRNAC